MDWRQIEQALIDGARAQNIIVNEREGSKRILVGSGWGNSGDYLDLTKLARDLQFEFERLGD